MPGIGIVTNPHSRQNRRRPGGMRKLAYILGDKGSCEATRDLGHIREVAEEFKRRGIEILGLNGGDGTNHLTLTAFIDVYGDTPLPRIAFLRGGTMNTVAAACGVQGSPARIVANLVEKYHTGQEFEIVERDTLKVDGRYGFIFGNGVIYHFLSEYYAHPEVNPIVAATTLARTVGSALVGGAMASRVIRPFKARVLVDGKEWSRREFIAIAASTVEQIGLGFRPFPRCEEAPGTFHVIGLTGDTLRLILKLPALRLGKPLDRRGFLEDVARSVVLESDAPVGYTLDGDTYEGSNRLEVSVGPRLQIIVR